MKLLFSLFIFLLLICNSSFCQVDRAGKNKLHIISLYSGSGYYVVRHEVIDKDRYCGIIVPVGIKWERHSPGNSVKAYANVNTGNIKSGIDDADIMNISMGLDYNFPVYKFKGSGINSGLFAGPSLFIYVNRRKQERIDIFDHHHTLGMIALGPNLGMRGSISDRINYSGIMRMNIVSFGGHDNFSTAVLGPFKGFHSSFTAALDWQLTERFGLALSYSFDYSNIDKWVDFIAGSDIILLGINMLL